MFLKVENPQYGVGVYGSSSCYSPRCLREAMRSSRRRPTHPRQHLRRPAPRSSFASQASSPTAAPIRALGIAYSKVRGFLEDLDYGFGKPSQNGMLLAVVGKKGLRSTNFILIHDASDRLFQPNVVFPVMRT